MLNHWFHRQRVQYAFYKTKDNVNPRLAKNLAKIKKFDEEPALFAGYIKSGNTWLRFLIFNYFNIKACNATETLTYRELNKIQHESLGDPIEPSGPQPGFPYLARTHRHYSSVFDRFSKGIHIYRNPLDTLVSAYHFSKNQPESKQNSIANVDHFVKTNLVHWELHTRSYLDQNHLLHVRYEDLQKDPIGELKKVIEYLGYTFEPKIAVKSIELSSFKSIKEMGREKNQKYGNGGPQYAAEFTRKGIIGSFHQELERSTIRFGSQTMNAFGYKSLLK